jgi:hypothetical protein
MGLLRVLPAHRFLPQALLALQLQLVADALQEA